MDEVRARYLRDRVMTATPAQRVVMLYDRLGLDITLARATEDPVLAGTHIGHATQVVAELLGSLDISAGGPADNLSAIYGHLLSELMGIRTSGELARLNGVEGIVSGLRDAWAQVAARAAETASPGLTAGSWVS